MPGIPSGKKQLDLAKLGGGLGSSDRGDTLVLSATAQKLVEMSEYFITEAQKGLDKQSTATGELEESIKAADIEIDGSAMSIDIMILDRYKFIDQGVRGTKSGSGKYAFKTSRPSLSMVKSIEKWLKVRGNRVVKYKPISNTERKDKKLPDKSKAWAVATNVKKNGIKATKFFTNAAKSTAKKFKDEIAKGYKIDIINSLKDGL